MNEYQRMWRRLNSILKLQIREYQNADAITGGLDYENEIEMDTWEGVLQEMERIEEDIKERE
ncbi:hypothetical protein [Mammaliicoccus fleurettii]|uniref:hypothetical protein n=1 Tax=Mammaliicoccus fleurettii TaxID=150056 RepID=UPI001AAC6880|nr:hypothetical protein [Mammaliicoccus fleurettii]MBO3062742.1 hypothetical protein [Mammaliicoccus fleurettii]